jgi:hypothetical protein
MMDIKAYDKWYLSTNKTHHHDVAKILLKVALNTITLTLTQVALIDLTYICITQI